jgi:ribosomal protein S21
MSRHDNRFPVTVTGLSVVVDRDFNKALRLFTNKVQESGILKEVRDRMHFESESEKKKVRKKMARKRWLKSLERVEDSKKSY